MMSSLDKLIRIIGILLIPIGVALFVKEFVFLERTAQEAVVSMVAALIGMIPEGLYLLTSVALAVSMIRLAQGKVLAQDMNCIETLARVDVLCVDKTGTITEPHMEVGEVVYLDEEKYAETVVTETLNAFYQSMEADNDTARRHGPEIPRQVPVACRPDHPLHLRHQVERGGVPRATAPLWWAPRSSSWGTATPI